MIPTQNPRAPSRRTEAAEALKACTDLFCHRVTLQSSAMFEALQAELVAQADKLEQGQARLYLDCKALLDQDSDHNADRFGAALRALVDESIDGRTSQDITEVSPPPSLSGLSLVDEGTIEIDVAQRVYAQRMTDRASEDFLKLTARLGSMLKMPDLSTSRNPFGPHVVAEATSQVLGKIFGDAALTTVVLRVLTKLLPIDLAAVYRDLNQFLQQRGVADSAPQRKAQRASRPGANKQGLLAAQDVLNDSDLSEQVASALMARVAQMHPQYAAMTGAGQQGYPPHGMQQVPPGFSQGGGAGYPQAGTGLNPNTVGGFPTLMPHQQGGAPLQLNVNTSPQYAALSLLGAPLPEGGGMQAMAGVAPQVIHSLGDAQRGVAMGYPQPGGGYGVGAGPATLSTEPLRAIAASPAFSQNASALDFTTIELVSMVFDFVFRDNQLHEDLKGQLSHLQIPMLKAALIDRNFFVSRTHPGRILLNRLADLGREWSAEDGHKDPIYTTIQGIVNDVVQKFDTDLNVFSRNALKLDTLASTLTEQAKPAEAIATVEIEVQDKSTSADAVARRAIRERLDRVPLPKFAVDFISSTWLDFVRKQIVTHGPESEEAKRALDQADILIDSIREHLDPDIRRRLIGQLPKLLTDLRAGCAAVNAPPEQSGVFFDQMFELHARLFKGIQVELPSTQEGQKEAVAPAKIDIELSTAPEDMFRDISMNMQKGMWIEMQDDVGKLKLAKLSWVSPQRTTYLFTTRQGHKAASLTPVQLAEWFREDRARILDSEPIVDRALNKLLSELVVEPEAR